MEQSYKLIFKYMNQLTGYKPADTNLSETESHLKERE